MGQEAPLQSHTQCCLPHSPAIALNGPPSSLPYSCFHPEDTQLKPAAREADSACQRAVTEQNSLKTGTLFPLSSGQSTASVSVAVNTSECCAEGLRSGRVGKDANMDPIKDMIMKELVGGEPVISIQWPVVKGHLECS